MADYFDKAESSSSSAAAAQRDESPSSDDSIQQTTDDMFLNYLVYPIELVFLLFKWLVLNMVVSPVQYFSNVIIPAVTPSGRLVRNTFYFLSSLVIAAIPIFCVYHFLILPQLDQDYSPAYFPLATTTRYYRSRSVEKNQRRQKPPQPSSQPPSENFIKQYAQVINHENHLYKKVWPELEQQSQFWNQIQLENDKIWIEINRTWSEIYAIDEELVYHQNQINEIKETLKKVVFIRDVETGDVGLLLHQKNKPSAKKFGNIETMVQELIKDAIDNYHQDVMTDMVDGLIKIAINKYQETAKGLIDTAINNYHQDVLNVADFALISRGAKIMYDLTTPTYFHKSAWIQGFKWFFGVPAATNSPEMALSPQTNVGNSWAMSGNEGYLGIRLSETIIVEGITIEFPSAEVMMNRMSSAPKDIEVFGLSDQDYHHELNNNGLLSLGTIQYDIHSNNIIQTFQLDSIESFSSVLIRIKSNWGNPDFTDVYRVRIHGTPITS